MPDLQLHPQPQLSITLIGSEQIPIIQIDNLVAKPSQLIEWAATPVDQQSSNLGFSYDPKDYYPGIRKPVPADYHALLNHSLWPFIRNNLTTIPQYSKVLYSAFSIATTPPNRLKPIQMLPHFDTTNPHQLAMVHYLCDQHHGGTSFYRHLSTGYQRITDTRLAPYMQQLKQQAIVAGLHQNPSYMDTNNPLFECIYSVAAQSNRAIIYPSNALHSGDIHPQLGLSADPQYGRLTISSFISTTASNDNST